MTAASSDLSRTAGLVLAGGCSSRFGADKALARFRGELLLDRAHRPLRGLPALAISAKAGSAIEAIGRDRGVTILTDDPNCASGPLAGILAGLEWADGLGFRSLAIVPCDAPLLPIDLVPALFAGIESSPAAYARTLEDDHPLCAIWSVTLRGLLGSALAQGRHPPVREFLVAAGARGVHFNDVVAFTNANTRDILNDLEQCT